MIWPDREVEPVRAKSRALIDAGQKQYDLGR